MREAPLTILDFRMEGKGGVNNHVFKAVKYRCYIKLICIKDGYTVSVSSGESTLQKFVHAPEFEGSRTGDRVTKPTAPLMRAIRQANLLLNEVVPIQKIYDRKLKHEKI